MRPGDVYICMAPSYRCTRACHFKDIAHKGRADFRPWLSTHLPPFTIYAAFYWAGTTFHRSKNRVLHWLKMTIKIVLGICTENNSTNSSWRHHVWFAVWDAVSRALYWKGFLNDSIIMFSVLMLYYYRTRLSWIFCNKGVNYWADSVQAASYPAR